MATAKEVVREVVDTQPADASYDEIIKELAFERMVERGLEDVRSDRVIDNSEMEQRISQWRS